MPTYIKEVPTKEWLLERFYVEGGFVYWKHKTISRGRKSERGGKRVNTYIDECGYYRIGIERKTYPLSRIIYQMYYGDLTPEYEVDHIDRDKLNNHITNLRKVLQEVNKRNKTKQKNAGSDNTGVCLNRKHHPAPHQDKYSDYYVARWYDADGVLRGKHFRIDKLGAEEAYRQAVEYRAKMIEQLNQQGLNYSDTHGT